MPDTLTLAEVIERLYSIRNAIGGDVPVLVLNRTGKSSFAVDASIEAVEGIWLKLPDDDDPLLFVGLVQHKLE